MRPSFETLRSGRGVLILAAAALVIAAVIMGLMPKPVIHRMDAKKAAQSGEANAIPPERALAPGESIVQPDPGTGPLMPHYSKPEPPPPGPAVPDEPKTPAAASAPARQAVEHEAKAEPPFAVPESRPAPALESRPGASLESRPAATPRPPPTLARHVCANCGRVEGVTVWPEMAEVRVLFETGATEVVRTAVPTRWHVGDTVRLERGRLVHD